MSDKLENTLYMDLEDGRVEITLRPDLAPQHVSRIKELVREGHYKGLTFHRVIPGFMAQAGCPDGDGTGGTGQKIQAEFTDTPYDRGTVGMARTMDPNSGDCQFFITFGPTPHLDGQYTVWAEVSEGMDLVDRINEGEPPAEPTVIKDMSVAADVADAA